MNSRDTLDFLAVVMAVPWLITGFAIWNRWGWCGVCWIWRKRREIDLMVVSDLSASNATERQGEGCRFHA